MTRLKIDSIAYRGSGIGRADDGRVWFVPGVCDNEEIYAKPVIEKKTFMISRLVDVLRPSSDRLDPPDCLLPPSAGANAEDVEKFVPGCVYAHASYEAELRWKQEQLLSFLHRQAKIENAPEILQAPCASPKRLNYRNKITLHYAPQKTLGYVAEDNETVIDIPACPLAAPQINELLAECRADPDFWRWVSREGSLALRWTPKNGALIADRGQPDLAETVPGLGEIAVPAAGFFQVNPEVAAALVEHVVEIAAPRAPRRVLDFYCGVGVFGLALAQKTGAQTLGWDTGRDVIRAANQNAAKLGLAAKFTSRAAESGMHNAADFVIVDPPRSGLAPEIAHSFASTPAAALIYVSCAPDTLARDLRIILASGKYTVKSATLFDMFPRTAHFETCVLLEPA